MLSIFCTFFWAYWQKKKSKERSRRMWKEFLESLIAHAPLSQSQLESQLQLQVTVTEWQSQSQSQLHRVAVAVAVDVAAERNAHANASNWTEASVEQSAPASTRSVVATEAEAEAEAAAANPKCQAAQASARPATMLRRPEQRRTADEVQPSQTEPKAQNNDALGLWLALDPRPSGSADWLCTFGPCTRRGPIGMWVAWRVAVGGSDGWTDTANQVAWRSSCCFCSCCYWATMLPKGGATCCCGQVRVARAAWARALPVYRCPDTCCAAQQAVWMLQAVQQAVFSFK